MTTHPITVGPVARSPLGAAGLAVPKHRLCVILPDQVAPFVHGAQTQLGEGIALDGGFAVPDHRLFVILHNPVANPVHVAQLDLRFGVASPVPVYFFNGQNLRRTADLP